MKKNKETEEQNITDISIHIAALSAMIDAGYQYRIRPVSNGIDFRWMLQAKG